MKYIFSLVIILHTLGWAQAQIVEVPLTSRLSVEQVIRQPQALNNIQRYEYLSLPSGGTEEVFYFQPIVVFDTLIIHNEEELNHVNISVDGSQITYTAEVVQSPQFDTLLFDYIDTNKNTYTYQIYISVRPIERVPFFDDFSAPASTASNDTWVEDYVAISQTQAMNPPSAGVALFDGLDQFGTPYGGGFGTADVLTSTFFDLRSLTDPALQFYFQPGGLGTVATPDRSDELILEFKDEDGFWQEVWHTNGGQPPTPPFEFVHVVIEEKYQYSGFQFRFSNISERKGVLSLWCLDFIYLDENLENTGSIPDVSLSAPPTSVFYPYYTIPSSQLKGQTDRLLADSFGVEIFQGVDELVPINDNFYRLIETTSGTTLLDETNNVIEAIFQQTDLERGIYSFKNALPIDVSGTSKRDQLLSDMRNLNFEADDSLRFQITYNIQPDVQSQLPQFDNNDQISRTIEVADYFAYDDGSAESAMVNRNNVGNDLIAIEYELFQPDTLKGIRAYFPYVAGTTTNERFEIVIWSTGLDETPDYSFAYDRAIHASAFGLGRDGFTTLALRTPNNESDTSIYMEAGKFYVGFRKIGLSTGIVFGLDKNTTEGNKHTFEIVNGEWQQIDSTFTGSIMIRPVFGPRTLKTTSDPSSSSDQKTSTYEIYPTVNQGNITVQSNSTLDRLSLNVYNMNGQHLLQKQLTHSNNVSLSALADGLYLIKLGNSRGEILHTQKIIINR